jgi:dipicolinate synthase subunit A
MHFFIPTADARAIKLASLLKKNEDSLKDSFDYITILPIPFTRDGVHLSKSDMKIESLFERDVGRGLYIGYDIPKKLCDFVEARGSVVIDVKRSESFLLKNASLTAEGTLGYILTNFNKLPRDLRIGIIGFGRIGRELTKLLLFLKTGKLIIYTSTESKGLFLAENTVDTRLVNYTCPDTVRHGFFDIDILINTAPKRLIGAMDLDDLKSASVIELASGDNMPKGLEYTPLMSIPANMYPESGGRVYYESAMENLLFLQENI